MFRALSLATFALCVSEIFGHYHGPPAPLNHDGTVAETPEVKHLKAERLAALHEAFAKAKGHGSYMHESYEHKNEVHYEKPQYRYHGPPAPLNHDGTVAETEEVKHIKAERLAALAEGFAKAKNDFYYHDRSKRSYNLIKSGHYHGPPAPLNHDGTVAETPEVQHLKAERLAALYEAFAKAPKGHEDKYETYEDDKQSYEHISHEQTNQIHHEKHEPQYRYHGPPAPLNHDGTVAETEEVKHIKAERLAALAEGFAKAKKDFYYHDRSKRSYDLIKSGHYHGPPAPLNHDGTVAETPEVKHLKEERLAALYEAFAKAPKGHDDKHESYDENQSYKHISHEQSNQIHHEQPQYRYHGPPAPLNHDGTVAETEEVKHLKAERLAALHEAFAKAPIGHEESYDIHDNYEQKNEVHKPHYGYHGPPAPLNHDGTVAETPEVHARKIEHLHAHHKAHHG